ncbi:RNA polymerase subunit sigma-70 [Lentzea flaviverrucosa]|uniref:RNA polymerase sigma-70 factor, ECF subfamily n=1 Tax=Lentzea flaviverrucosa TaxID=200379 RepID=A0A1H9FZX4_9PSEU|nr:RNA polymerase subunit sigma-70 [Lentzea flaviverrucosa]RDI35052.1 RNA polymerase ECF family sigma subunit [Lentzea flaviverrucosa]SEQ43436.1 RNA polymerase sigma-70 factor, ECF subfamily [Lentzea flaviverrucosa]
MIEALEPFRVELNGYCYRMLGSGFEAEDAVQETLVRAWKAFDSYDSARASLRTWLYRIATNICIDMQRSAQRRALAVDLGPYGGELGAPLLENVFVQPVPDALVLPEDQAIRRETVRLAFVAALQHLPPRQRAVLILRDVLAWQASEVAALLSVSVASVTSALQRARATLRVADVGTPLDLSDPVQKSLLSRYCEAFDRHDVRTLVALLHEDATMSMPPFSWWLRGRESIALALSDPGAACAGAWLVPVRANASPAFWQMRPGLEKPFGLVFLDVRDGSVTGNTTYLNVDELLPLFGSPPVTPMSSGPPSRTSADD